MATRSVLITGCSSGIGRATAMHLRERGWRVWATARDPQTLAELSALGCRTLALDVTDDQSVRLAVQEAEAAEDGALDALVNNAGYALTGASETLPLAAVRRQFETNVLGPLRMISAVAPGMRKCGLGRIINVSSMGGTLTLPGAGAYHASKYALEAFSDALRYELAPSGIKLVVIQPGLIRTGFADAATVASRPALTGPYADFDQQIVEATHKAYEHGPLARLGGPPVAVARAIHRALAMRSPKARITVTASANLLMGLRKLMSDSAWDGFLRSQFPSPQMR